MQKSNYFEFGTGRRCCGGNFERRDERSSEIEVPRPGKNPSTPAGSIDESPDRSIVSVTAAWGLLASSAVARHRCRDLWDHRSATTSGARGRPNPNCDPFWAIFPAQTLFSDASTCIFPSPSDSMTLVGPLVTCTPSAVFTYSPNEINDCGMAHPTQGSAHLSHSDERPGAVLAQRDDMVAYVLDDYYLAITAIATVAYQLFFFSIAFSLKFDKLTDFAGGTNFVLLAALTLGLSSANGTTPDVRQIIASLMLVIWAARLAAFLAYRVHKTGSDSRFDDKRDKFFPFLGFWIFQMIWVFTISLPVTILNSPKVRAFGMNKPEFGTARDIVGLIMWAIGFFSEAIGDWQRFTFRDGAKAKTRGKGAWCDKGLWAWSRHPNYFGEMLLQFGIYTIAVTPAFHGVTGGAASALHASIVGPLLLTLLLLFVSGLPLSERPGAKKRWEIGGETWEGYKRYLGKTSMLMPLPPKVYAPLPTWLKRTILMEWGLYRFDPEVHGGGEGRGNSDEEEARPSGPRGSGEDGLDERVRISDAINEIRTFPPSLLPKTNTIFASRALRDRPGPSRVSPPHPLQAAHVLHLQRCIIRGTIGSRLVRGARGQDQKGLEIMNMTVTGAESQPSDSGIASSGGADQPTDRLGCHFWLAKDPLFLAPSTALQKYPQTGTRVPLEVQSTAQKPTIQDCGGVTAQL
ncbi:hypothetical protein MKZ38_000593 [Zalerion maritima]|uniref:Steroid 5-alpha reductase C-terminal domain-containing protein n=1 Tax=Zalerion maritima TaxID=339359 RepID=A0AAD5RRD5_9PEZI|nr:hypothetical protein MKZ38_000593 [Zalerion maritima]